MKDGFSELTVEMTETSRDPTQRRGMSMMSSLLSMARVQADGNTCQHDLEYQSKLWGAERKDEVKHAPISGPDTVYAIFSERITEITLGRGINGELTMINDVLQI